MSEKMMSDEERIEAALAQLETRADGDHPQDSTEVTCRAPPTSPALSRGPTLTALGSSRLPKVSTICELCPLSLWFASAKELRCYCRLMFTVTWDSTAPLPLTHCDGPQLPAR